MKEKSDAAGLAIGFYSSESAASFFKPYHGTDTAHGRI